jgi:glycerophosphoryl diester phosphodiesterase
MKNYLRVLICIALVVYTVIPQAEPENTPRILAHRASSGLWIQNSRYAVEQTLLLYQQNQEKFHGLEVDIAMTKDKVLVLSHDPWVHKKLCKTIDGEQTKEVLIKNILWRDLQKNYRCGGISDPDFPDAKTKNEAPMRLEELFSLAKTFPEFIIYLDLKLQEPLTASANDYAQAIFTVVEKSNLKNPLYIEGPNTSAISALSHHATRPFTAVLSYPPFYTNENWWVTGAASTIYALFFPSHGLEKVHTANADAIASPILVMNASMQQQLQNANKRVIVFTRNNKKAFNKACDRGVNVIITDFPTLGSCEHH